MSQDDRAINPELERFYAKRMNAKTSEVKASHVAFISHPDVVARLIEQAAGAAAKSAAPSRRRTSVSVISSSPIRDCFRRLEPPLSCS